MDKKVEVEISLKDNLSKQLSSLSDKVKNVAKDMQNSVKAIQNAFNGITLNLDSKGIDNSISNIKNKINQLSKEKVEINGEVNIDETNLKNVGSGIDSTAMLVATSQMQQGMAGVSATMSNVSNSVSQMSNQIRSAFGASITDTEAYQGKIQAIIYMFEDLKKFDGITLDNDDSAETCAQELGHLKTFFDDLKDSANGAEEAIRAIESMQSNIGSRDTFKNAMPDIEKQIKEMQSASKPQKGIEIPIEIKNFAENVAEINRIKYELSQIDIGFKTTNLQVIDELKAKIKEVEEAWKKAVVLDGKSTDSAEVKELEGALESLQTDLKYTEQRYKELTQEQSKLRTELSNTEKALKSSEFKNLSNSLKQSNQSTNETAGAFKRFAKQIEEVKNKLKELRGETDQTAKSSEKMKSAFSSFKSTLASLGIMMGISQLAQFAKSAVETASSIAEIQNVLDTVFRVKINGVLHDSAEDINKWANECSSAFGLTSLQAKKFASTFGAMLSASDVNFDYIDEMSMKLSQLAGKKLPFLIEILVIIIAKLNWKPKYKLIYIW